MRGVLREAGAERQGGFTFHEPIVDADFPLRALIDQIEAAGPGVVLTMGKGGVGKTTVASAVALELARRGRAVHLTTTDPAAHVL